MYRPPILLAVLLSTLFAAYAGDAALWMPALFSDRMVLQRGKEVPVWGKANPWDKVTVKFENQEVSSEADFDGRWSVKLAPLQASAEARDLTIVCGDQKKVIHQVVVGEVWLMSGQSNMAFLMSSILRTPEILGSERRAEAAKAPKGPSQVKAEKDMAGANDPLLRTFRVHTVSAERVREDAVSREGWMEWNKKNAPEFSAMGAYFGLKLREALDVPVGILMCAWGGSSACSWISADTMRSPALNGLFPEDVPDWGANLSPSRLYNGMLKPVAPFAISGFCWYQGETEATELQNAYVYRYLLPALIGDWRAAWRDQTLPFYFVQLPPLNNGERWEIVRESQAQALAVPGTGMVPTLDIVPPGDLHPKNKHAVAARLADLVLGTQYGKDTWPGLTSFDRAEVLGDSMKIHFKNAEGGLTTLDGQTPAEFQLAGKDRVFKPAKAVVERDTIVVTSPEIQAPVAVRYAFVQSPRINLVNGGGIPVPPFRSDDWPVVGQEMTPHDLPVKEKLAVTVPGSDLLGAKAAPWVPSDYVINRSAKSSSGEGKEKSVLAATKNDIRIQLKGFSQRSGVPASPQIFWTAEPEDVDPARGLTMEVATHIFEIGNSDGGFEIEVGMNGADQKFRRYRMMVFPSRIYTFQNFLGGRVPDNVQKRLLRSDMDDVAHVFRIAVRPDGVAQLYDGAQVLGTTTGEVLSTEPKTSYLRFGKTAEGGKWSANIYHAAFDTSGAFAPGKDVAVSAEVGEKNEE